MPAKRCEYWECWSGYCVDRSRRQGRGIDCPSSGDGSKCPDSPDYEPLSDDNNVTSVPPRANDCEPNGAQDKDASE